jgi:three-Cys-motif partner protein
MPLPDAEFFQLVEKRFAADDGLPTRDCGPWTLDKLFWWARYARIVTGGLSGRPTFPKSLVYVDLFAGPGVLVTKESRTRKPGSVLLAASTEKPFNRIIACEKDPALADALRQRLASCGVGSRAVVIEGDCHEQIDKVIGEIPKESLTLAFVDPEGLHVKFTTLKALANSENAVDFLILVATEMDFHRNFERYLSVEDSPPDEMFGPDSGWRQKIGSIRWNDGPTVSQFVLDLLKNQMQRWLGYEYFDVTPLKRERDSRVLYHILFASRNKLGLQFWEASKTKDRSGQKRLGFDDD